MTPERWQKAKELCHLALDREPPERAAFLAGACAGDEPLRREVESLIARMTSEGILDAPIFEKLGIGAAVAATGTASECRLPATLGRYRILRLVGEGGMGVVYQAEQEQPRRIVALKVIKPGLASAELLRRFERESEILARLQHSGIAQIYEAGAADAGAGPQPYFAMEYIHGAPLGEYAESHHLDSRERLELIARICDAVEHAHQRGIIHRDLKPGNILVEESGQPKILDFGVARATDVDAQATRQTDLGQLIGTLAYMSPEQVLADPLELDTRSDVYALGVILYELLAKRLPYAVGRTLQETMRAIREDDPTRLSAIHREYRGDVDTIVAKALEKDKARRYASAAELAADIRRYLTDQPIAARPASTAYQLRKFARRHRALVTAAAAICIVLVAGIVVSTREALRARRAEQTAQAVNDFLQNDLLAQASAANQGPTTKPDPHLEVRTALDRAAARIGGKFAKQPEVEAAIRDTIGRTYIDLGLYAEARAQLERARQLEREALGPEDPKTLATTRTLAMALFNQGKYPESEALLNNTLQVQRRVLGPQHSETLLSMTNLALVYDLRGKYGQAEKLGTELLAIQRKVWGPDHPETLKTMNNLALVYHDQGKYPQMEDMYRQLVEIRRRVLGPEHPDTAKTISNLAWAYWSEGNVDRARDLYSESLEILRRVLGPDHPNTTLTMNNLVLTDVAQGKYTAAEALAKQALAIRRRVLGQEHPDTLQSLHNLAWVDYMEGRYRESEAIYNQTIELRRKVLGAEHPKTLLSFRNLADVYTAQREYARAEAVLNQVLEVGRRVQGPEHPETLLSLVDFTSLYQQQGKYALAETYGAQALAGRRRSLGAEHPDTMSSALDLARVYVSERKFGESEPLARAGVEFMRKKQPNDPVRFIAESLWGASLAGQKKYAGAEPLLVGAYQGMMERKERIAIADRWQMDQVRDWIVQLYQDWGQPDQAAQWRARK